MTTATEISATSNNPLLNEMDAAPQYTIDGRQAKYALDIIDIDPYTGSESFLNKQMGMAMQGFGLMASAGML